MYSERYTDLRIIYLDMPTSIHEVVTIDDDGDYVIALNSRDSYYVRRKNYNHAINHIKRRDFESYNADSIECRCHECDRCKNA